LTITDQKQSYQINSVAQNTIKSAITKVYVKLSTFAKRRDVAVIMSH